MGGSLETQVDSFVIKSSDLDFRPVRDGHGKTKTVKVGKWACEMHECTGDMQLQTFRKGPGDNLLAGISMKVNARCALSDSQLFKEEQEQGPIFMCLLP